MRCNQVDEDKEGIREIQNNGLEPYIDGVGYKFDSCRRFPR
jgi:hypothetical protein